MQESNSSAKRVAKNTLLLYTRMLVMMALGLYTSRVTLQALGVDNYGIYNVVGGIVVILGFLNNAMSGATQRFINVALGRHNQNELNKIISNAVIMHGGVAIICLVLAETLGLWFLNEYMVFPADRVVATNWVFQFSVFTFLVNVLSVPFMADIIAHEKMSAYAWITIFDVVMKLVIVLSLLYFSFDKLILYAFLLFVNGIITCLIYVMYCKKHFEECKMVIWEIDKPLLKSMSSFSSWTIVGNLGYIGHTQGIAIIINLFFGVAVNAAQGIANQVNSYVRQFISNFLLAFNPQVVKTYAANEVEEMHKLVLRGCKISLLMAALFVVPLIIETPSILHLWLGIVPEYAVIFVRLILLLTFFDAYSNLLSTAKGATGDIKTYQITLTIIGLFHLPLAWICFKIGLEPYWAQIVYLFIVIILQIVRTGFVCHSIHLSQRLFYKEVVARCYLSIGFAALVPIALHLYMEPSLIRVLLVCSLSVLLSGIMALYFGLNKQERSLLFELVKKKLRKS